VRIQVRVLLLAAVLAMAAGWVGLRRGNEALARQAAASPAAGGVTP
jgi:hypothetical protein